MTYMKKRYIQIGVEKTSDVEEQGRESTSSAQQVAVWHKHSADWFSLGGVNAHRDFSTSTNQETARYLF